jgi:hypothetical protein
MVLEDRVDGSDGSNTSALAVAEEWFVLFPNYFLKAALLRLFVVQETHNSTLRLVHDKFRIRSGRW